MRAVIYARYSSEGQREASIEDQVRECTETIRRRGWTVVAIYEDKALSGQLGEGQRPGFQAMMEATKQRAFDVLVVDDSSRLSRDTADALRALSVMDFYGVRFIGRSDGIDTTQNGSRLLFGIKAAMSEEFLRDLAAKTHRGLEGRARKGYSAGGLPYGYRSEPVRGDRGEIIGYRKVIYDPEAEIVRRIFRLYVGDEAPGALSPRAIAHRLNLEGSAPPGARWRNKTVRQATTWSYTAILGHRRLRKGILNNTLYIGQALWNRSQWMRHPITKAYTYRVRPQDDWIAAEVPELRIVPQDLWDRAQVRLALHDAPRANGQKNVGKYLLSGFVKCAICGGTYVKNNRSYRCGTHRNRGEVVCSNKRGIYAARMERLVVAALRERLYTPENFRTIIKLVRDKLLARAKQERRLRAPEEGARLLREVEQEIANLKDALRFGKATATITEMIEDAERRRSSLLAGRQPLSRDAIEARLEKVLDELPERVGAYLEDLETLLAQHQVERGKDILASLGTEIIIRPDGTAEIRGDLGKALAVVSGRQRESVLSWLGEEDSNPR